MIPVKGATLVKSNSALVAFVSALVIALITAIFAYFRYVREQEHQRKTILNALFAELANILQHCTFAAYELPSNSTSPFDLEKRLRWAKHGMLRSANDVTKLGFLSASNVCALLQLELSMRNDNSYLDQLIPLAGLHSSEHISIAQRRLLQRAHQASELLGSLVDSNPRLRAPFAALKNELPIVKSRP